MKYEPFILHNGLFYDAEQKEWAEIRGKLPNLEGSRNLAIYRAEQLGGSEETTKERDLAMAAAGIGAGSGSGKGDKGNSKQPANEQKNSSNKGNTNTKPNKENINSSALTGITQKQLDKKFKHAIDFGITTTKKNPDKAIYDSLSVTAKVALYTKDAADNMGVGGAVPGAGISVAGIKGSGNKGTVPKQPNPSNVKPDNSVNIATNFTKTPQAIWGRSTDDIAKDFKAAGYQVNVRQSSRGSGQAVIIEVKGHPEISQIQYHPGGGRHGGSYYKVSTTTQGTMKVVDPSTYKPTQGEKATIINKTKE